MEKLTKDITLASKMLANTAGWIQNFGTPWELQEHSNDDPRTKDCTITEVMNYEEDEDLAEFLSEIYNISTKYMFKQATKRIAAEVISDIKKQTMDDIIAEDRSIDECIQILEMESEETQRKICNFLEIKYNDDQWDRYCEIVDAIQKTITKADLAEREAWWESQD